MNEYIMNEYIMMNKEENRTLFKNCDGRLAFTGELGNSLVRRFTILTFKGKLRAYLYSLFNGLKMVKVEYNEKYIMPTTDYIWLKFNIGLYENLVVKVYREDLQMKPPNSSIIFHNGRVMIEGLGNFVWSDFVEVVF